ncbi:MAG: ATP-binding protein [Bryobacterales bacterium]|nr:ATP-binding protein [Bryobacterales bacterium]MDE0262161.1 ATP-binding protein [Bryobacterales bacterium]MDE0621377.1 ATP-binding protein [Bryobacterales bacterium]
MLLRFQVSNHRSILEPVELSMIAVDKDREATRRFDGVSEHVLTAAGIYGPNASGKSNVLDAMAWLSMAVARSLRGWTEYIPRDAHRFSRGPASPTEFDLDLEVDGVRYTYRLELNDSAVLFESLDSYPQGRRRNLFTRAEGEIDFRRGLSGTHGIQALLTPTTLALSAGRRVGASDLRGVARALSSMRILRPRNRRIRWAGGIVHFDSTEELLADEEADQPPLFDTEQDRSAVTGRRSAMELLRFADSGINDFAMTEEESERFGVLRRRLRLIHRGEGESVVFGLEDESDGTQTWFRLIGPAFAALRRGRVLLLDEIDASLHPRLSARLIEIFQDPQTNSRGAQLVFTSHDTSLLNSLNRDEVWLTERAPNATTRLIGLAEFRGERVRKSVNLERAYLQGRFGAVPEVDQAAVRRALGLVSRPADV